MSATNYQLRKNDDIREARIKLTSSQTPDTATLVIRNDDLGVRITRPLTEDGDTGEWVYRFLDTDFDVLVPGVYQCDVEGVFGDGSGGTYPTKRNLTLTVIAVL